MIGSAIQVVGLNTGSTLNYNLLGGACCAPFKFKLKLNIGALPVVLQHVQYSDSCGVVHPITVNGQIWHNPLTTPVTIGVGDEIEVVVNVCGCNAPGDPNSYTLTLTYDDPIIGNNTTQTFTGDWMSVADWTVFPVTDQAYVNTFPCINDCDTVKPEFLYFKNQLSVDYGMYVVLSTPGITVTINGVPAISYLDIAPPVPGDPFTFIATAGQTFEIGFLVCPIVTASFTETINIYDQCGGASLELFPVNFTPVTCGDCGLNTQDLTLATENDYLFPAIELQNTPVNYNQAAIGEKKILKWTLQYEHSFQGGNIDLHFNPWMFGDTCNFSSKYIGGIIDGPPPTSYFLKIQPTMIGSGVYNIMTLIGAGGNANSQRNWKCWAKVLTDYLVEIKFEFFLVEDIDNWVSNIGISNQPKLLKNHIFNPIELDNSVYSVYNNDRSFCVLAVIVDPKVPPVGPASIYSCGLTQTIPMTARFWNRGLYDADSEMINPTWTLERDGNVVTNLSAVQITKVKFRVKYPVGTPPNAVVFNLFNAGNTNDTVDFLQNYQMSRGNVAVNNPVVGTLDNFIKTPTTYTDLGGGEIEVSAFISGMAGNSGPWYLGAVVYVPGFSMVNSFLLGPLSVSPIPGPENCCSPDVVVDRWDDYFGPLGDICATPTMKERIRNTVQLGAGDFGTCLEQFGWDPENVSWLYFAKSVTLNIYRRVNAYPSPTLNTLFIYQTLTSLRNVGFPGNWQNLSSGLVVSDTAGTTNLLDIEWSGRVMYEQTPFPGSGVFTAPNTAFFTRTPAAGAGSTYVAANNVTNDWSNSEIFFEYVIQYDVSELFGGNTCFFNHVIINKIRPIGIEPNTGPFSQDFKPLLVQGVKGVNLTTIVGQFCSTDFDSLKITLESLAPLDGELIAFLEPVGGGMNSLLEHENSPSTNGFVQLQAVQMFDVDPGHVGLKSQFFVDLSTLTPGKYTICAMYRPKP